MLAIDVAAGAVVVALMGMELLERRRGQGAINIDSLFFMAIAGICVLALLGIWWPLSRRLSRLGRVGRAGVALVASAATLIAYTEHVGRSGGDLFDSQRLAPANLPAAILLLAVLLMAAARERRLAREASGLGGGLRSVVLFAFFWVVIAAFELRIELEPWLRREELHAWTR
jgi:hypothetical protein